MNDFTSSHLVQIYAAHSVAFSVCLLIFLRTDISRNIIYWIIANLLGTLGFVVLYFRGDEINFYTFVLPNALNFFGGVFRALAVMRPMTRRTVTRPDSLFLLSSIAVFMLLAVPQFADYRLVFVLVSAMLVAISAAIAVIRNPLWAGSSGQKWLLAFLAIAITGFIWRLSRAYPFGPYSTFIGQSAEQYAGLVVLLVVSFFLQIGFMLLIADRLRRTMQMTARRAARANERSRQLVQRRQAAEKLASERLRMLNVLTHEVRQPLNNAQAALQSVLTEIEPEHIQRDKLWKAASRAQSVLDDITLALSNSIVGAMVVQRKQDPALRECEVLAIAELSRTDCPREQAGRIAIDTSEDAIFLAVDPILLRLALRNLLHNAIKFSPPDSLVKMKVEPDADRLGVSFQVTNQVAAAPYLDKISLPADSGPSKWPLDGKHLGLFVVSEVARVHHGQLNVKQSDEQHVTVELFIPK